MADAEKPLSTMETGNHLGLFFGEIQDLLNEPGLLLLHLHDHLNAAAVQDALAVLAAVQRHHIGHTLGGNAGNAALRANELYHAHRIVGSQRIGVGAHQLPQLI